MRNVTMQGFLCDGSAICEKGHQKNTPQCFHSLMTPFCGQATIMTLLDSAVRYRKPGQDSTAVRAPDLKNECGCFRKRTKQA